METQPLEENSVRAFCQSKMVTDTTLKHDTQFQLIQGGVDWNGQFKSYTLWTYWDHHTLLRPGFLDPVVSDNPNSYLGARISCECRNLSEDPRDWTFLDVVVLEVKSRQGGGDRTILGLLGTPRKATPVDDRTHDDKPKTSSNGSKTRQKLK